jgi:hypothetical protein
MSFILIEMIHRRRHPQMTRDMKILLLLSFSNQMEIDENFNFFSPEQFVQNHVENHKPTK